MPKINFNVPFLNEKGEPIKQLKVDPDKIKIAANGQAMPAVESDADGNAILEIIYVKDLLAKVLNMTFEGDAKTSFSDRAKRGKLARKIQTNSSVNYTDAEIEIIQDLCAKSGSTILLAQLDDLFGAPESDQAA